MADLPEPGLGGFQVISPTWSGSLQRVLAFLRGHGVGGLRSRFCLGSSQGLDPNGTSVPQAAVPWPRGPTASSQGLLFAV